MAAENLRSLVTHGGHGCWKINELNWTTGLLPRVTSEWINYWWLQGIVKGYQFVFKTGHSSIYLDETTLVRMANLLFQWLRKDGRRTKRGTEYESDLLITIARITEPSVVPLDGRKIAETPLDKDGLNSSIA